MAARVIAASVIGTLPAWITVAILISAVLIFIRGGGGTAIQSLQIANEVLEKRVQQLMDQSRQLEDQNKRQAAEIAELRARTDVTAALSPVISAVQLHEQQAAKRAERTLTVLDLIAKRLGPDLEGSEP